MTEPIQAGFVENRILIIRGEKVLLDRDLASLYHVRTKELNKAVKRNRRRFPVDFMFQLSHEEQDSLRFQFGTLKRGQHSKYPPYAFTELGVAMLSSVLKSEQAIQVNIAIMRAFVRMREILAVNKELAKRLEAAERRLLSHDAALGEHAVEIRTVFQTIRKLLAAPRTPRPAIGFKPSTR